MMTKKEQIKAEIDNIPEEHLEELYRMIKDFGHAKKKKPTNNFMTRLKRISINGPEDFSKNIDLYLTGDKSVE